MEDLEDLNDTFSKENNIAIAMKNIFESCDESQTGKVTVSKLVDFIKPYMAANVSEINALQMCLDPNNSDPEITSDVFYNVMSDWAKKFDQEDSFHHISPCHLDNPPLVESTPRKSFGGRQSRIYAEAVALDMSVVEPTSFLGVNSNENVLEKSILEDQIKQLTHQSRKFNDELLLARSQLNGQEEQNLYLQSEIEKLNKDLKHERELNETLQKEHKILEDARENSYNKQRYIDQLKKDLQTCEREKAELQDHNTSLDIEKQKIEEKMQNLHEKLSEARRETIELRTEMNMKDEQIACANDIRKDLVLKITDLKDTLANLEEENSCLRVEKEKMSKLLQNNLKMQSQAVLGFTPQKQSEYPKDDFRKPTTTAQDALTKHTHADITKYFSPNLFTGGTSQLQEVHSTSELSDEGSQIDDDTTPEARKQSETIGAAKPVKGGKIRQRQSIGRSSEVTERYDKNGQPIPFVSPIKTSKFKFFNIDSPIAKRCERQRDLLFNDNSPKTPTDLVSPPGMYVIERTVERKEVLDVGDVSIDEGGNEELLQTAFASITPSSQASLMDELVAIHQSEPQSSSEHVCPNCNMGVEVKRRLDNLCDQIDWLKTDNVNLKQSEERLIYLLQNTERLELDNQQQNKTISDLNKTLEVSKLAEDDLKAKCTHLEKRVLSLQTVEKNYDDYVREFAGTRKLLQDVENEKEKLLKENTISQDMINRLKNEISTLENGRKRMDLLIQTLQADKEKIVEQHNNRLDELEGELTQSQVNIRELEVKFYANNDQLISLLAQNKELASNHAKLKQENQKISNAHQEITLQMNEYVTIIDKTSSKDLSVKQKLNLLKTEEEYNILLVKYEGLIEQMDKVREEYCNKIQELEEKGKQCRTIPSKETQTAKKAPHDRAQIQLERYREKLDYLEDVIKQDKLKHAAYKKEIEQLREYNECLYDEKNKVSGLQKCYRDLVTETRDLLSNCVRARRNMIRFYTNWKPLFEKVSSIEMLYTHLYDGEVMNSLCSQMSAISTEMAQPQSSGNTLTFDQQICMKEMAHSKDYLLTISLMLEALGACDSHSVLDTMTSRTSVDVSKSVLSFRPISLKTREALLSRPMSPDSPNLGTFDDVTSFTLGAGDEQLSRFKNSEVPDSEGCDAGEDADRSSSEDEFDESTGGPFEVLRTMYLPENLEFLIASIRATETMQTAEQLDDDAESALAAFVDDFGLTFMVDCTGYGIRLRAHFEQLQAAVTRLMTQFQALLSIARSPKKQMRAASGLVECLFDLIKLAERYGAIQQEAESSHTISKLIAYITHLRNDSVRRVAHTFSNETTMVETASLQSGDNPQRQCEVAMQTSHHRVMSFLHSMRPTNVVRLVGAAALAFLIYYFSQRFVFLTVEGNSSGHYGGGVQRNAVCWAAWVDFLAACVGRLHEDGPPPI